MSVLFTQLHKIILIFCIVEFSFVFTVGVTTEDPESWTGLWFPEKPKSLDKVSSDVHSSRNRTMGNIDHSCDDGKTNLTLDWNGKFEDYVCFHPRSRFATYTIANGITIYENIPKSYEAPHYCMDTPITYSTPLPTFGPHRPLWPRYGEYIFLPKQRWLHTLEHGGIAALYHPCANPGQIKLFKKVVKGCLRRYVITPSRDVKQDKPFALIAWGVMFLMPYVDIEQSRNFILNHALHGPEAVPKDGQYDYLLISPAKIVSDLQDSKLCP